MKYTCPVCGYKGLDEPPYYDSKQLKVGSFEICSCCRFEFAVDDDVELESGELLPVRDVHNIYRSVWLNLDAPVASPNYYPSYRQEHGKVKSVHLEQQLKNIGINVFGRPIGES